MEHIGYDEIDIWHLRRLYYFAMKENHLKA